MKILVTGGVGYIGSVLVPKLKQAGWDVVIVDKVAKPKLNILGPGDLQKAMAGCDAVIHLAAIVGEGVYNKDRSKGRLVNVHGTQMVVGEAVSAGVKRLVFASTGNVYGVVSGPATEAVQPNPLCEYGYSKLIGEEVVKEAGYVSVRFGTACGRSPKMRWDLLPNAISKAAREGRGMDIYSPEVWRPFTHIEDATDALVALVGVEPNGSISGKVFNVVSENVRKGELAGIAKEEFGWDKVGLVGMPDKRNYQMDGGLIERTIGWRPKRTVRKAMVDAYDTD